jgi:capsular exopolysaccharide synthesis family protein
MANKLDTPTVSRSKSNAEVAKILVDEAYGKFNNYFDNVDNQQPTSGAKMNSQNPDKRNHPHKPGKSGNDRIDTDWINPFVKAPFQFREAFLSLRTNIAFLSATNDINKIIVTSSIPGEGKSSVAVNLALSLSSANNSVLLVDADLRKPRVHKLLSIPDGTKMGLTNVLRDKNSTGEGCIRHKIDNKGLSVIPCGVIPPNPAEILGSAKLGHLIAKLGEAYDYVIFDTPPVSVVTDAAVLSQFSDGVLFVVRQKDVTFEQAKLAKGRLEAVNANILGVVINDFNLKHVDKSDSYYNYYHYGGQK